MASSSCFCRRDSGIRLSVSDSGSMACRTRVENVCLVGNVLELATNGCRSRPTTYELGRCDANSIRNNGDFISL